MFVVYNLVCNDYIIYLQASLYNVYIAQMLSFCTNAINVLKKWQIFSNTSKIEPTLKSLDNPGLKLYKSNVHFLNLQVSIKHVFSVQAL